MTYLRDLLNIFDLEDAIREGYVREREHPDDPTLKIYNYAEKAQYEKVWTDVTRQCRGLIVHDGEVVARPWPKFFNYGEHPDGSLDLDAGAEVTDKLDGSLGILYQAPDGPAIATRGSFTSEQALHATALYRERYAGKWSPTPGRTYLFEIIYPENRIVLDYGRLDDLYLLSIVENGSGHVWSGAGDWHWPGDHAPLFPVSTLREALVMPPRKNAEGLVVRLRDDTMIKLKQDDYVALHRIVTGLSEKTVWEHLRDNDGDVTALLESLPDEFHGWVEKHAEDLLWRHEEIYGLAWETHQGILDQLPEGFERRDYANLTIEHENKSLLFGLLDGKDIGPAIWKQLKPVGHTPMKITSEETA